MFPCDCCDRQHQLKSFDALWMCDLRHSWRHQQQDSLKWERMSTEEVLMERVEHVVLEVVAGCVETEATSASAQTAVLIAWVQPAELSLQSGDVVLTMAIHTA